jgi:hypothetical protein
MISRKENYLKPLEESSWYSARTRLGASAQSNREARPLIGPVDACGGMAAGSPSSCPRPCGPMGPGRGGGETISGKEPQKQGFGCREGELLTEKSSTHQANL